jgi:hypothetical protein
MLGTLARGAQRSEAEHAAAAPVTFDHAIAGGSCRGWINAEHPEKIPVRGCGLYLFTLSSEGEPARISNGLRHGPECTAARRARPHLFRRRVRWRPRNASLFVKTPAAKKNTSAKPGRSKSYRGLRRPHYPAAMTAWISFSSMSKLAETRWTSSCSSSASTKRSICAACVPVSFT